MGLALYDQRQPGGDALLLTPWTAGLQSVFVTWGEDEAGVNYLTVGQDGWTRAHYLLAMREDGGPGWRVTWYGDENRNWWLNGFQGQLEVASDLSRLTLLGLSDGTTIAFRSNRDRNMEIYTIRPDGFVSVFGPYTGGEMITKPLILYGNRLSINFASSAVGLVLRMTRFCQQKGERNENDLTTDLGYNYIEEFPFGG